MTTKKIYRRPVLLSTSSLKLYPYGKLQVAVRKLDIPSDPEVSDLPAPPRAPVTIAPPPVPNLPKGPFDVRQALPWDPHVYPPIPTPPELPPGAEFERKLAEALKRKLGLDKKKGSKKGSKKRKKALAYPGDASVFADVGLSPDPSEVEVQRALKQDIKALGLFDRDPLKVLDRYLDACGIRYFSAHELTSHRWRHSKGRTVKGAATWWFTLEILTPKFFPSGAHFVLPEHVVPPPELWPRIIPALRVLDRFRHWYGKPVRAFSGYRLPWYNTQIEGDSRSFHMSFSAIDFTFAERTKQGTGELDVVLFQRWFEQLYNKKGDGLGAYPNFIHIDVGHSRHKLKGKAERWIHRKRMDRVGLRGSLIGKA